MRGDVNWHAIRAGQPHYVYRCYDAEGVLLYVGMTYNPPARMRQHSKKAEWFPRAVAVRFIVFPTRDYAMQKEREAIVLERPEFNKAHRDWQPWRVGLVNDDYIYDDRDMAPEAYADFVSVLNACFKRPESGTEEPDAPTIHDRKRESLRVLRGGAA